MQTKLMNSINHMGYTLYGIHHSVYLYIQYTLPASYNESELSLRRYTWCGGGCIYSWCL